MTRIVNDNYCFACGKDNPLGLHLEFTYCDNKAITEFILSREFQGYSGIAHGGIITTVLDECMAWLAINDGLNVVTAKMITKFRKPALTGEKLICESRYVKKSGKLIHICGEVKNQDDEVVAESEGIFILVSEEIDE